MKQSEVHSEIQPCGCSILSIIDVPIQIIKNSNRLNIMYMQLNMAFSLNQKLLYLLG